MRPSNAGWEQRAPGLFVKGKFRIELHTNPFRWLVKHDCKVINRALTLREAKQQVAEDENYGKR